MPKMYERGYAQNVWEGLCRKLIKQYRQYSQFLCKKSEKANLTSNCNEKHPFTHWNIKQTSIWKFPVNQGAASLENWRKSRKNDVANHHLRHDVMASPKIPNIWLYHHRHFELLLITPFHHKSSLWRLVMTWHHLNITSRH